MFELAGADAAEVKLILRRGSPALIRSHGLDPAGKVGDASLDVLVHEMRVSR